MVHTGMNRPADAFIGHFGDVLTRLREYFPIETVGIEKRNEATSHELLKFCEEQHLPVFRLESNQDISRMLDSGCFRYLFVAGFGIILNQKIINRVERVINLHMGLLPQCRGRHPLPSAILNHHTTAGVTAHLIVDEHIDNGPIICQASMPIDYQASYNTNEEALRLLLGNLAPAIHIAHKRNWTSLTTPTGESNYYKPYQGETLADLFNASSLDAYKS